MKKLLIQRCLVLLIVLSSIFIFTSCETEDDSQPASKLGGTITVIVNGEESIFTALPEDVYFDDSTGMDFWDVCYWENPSDWQNSRFFEMVITGDPSTGIINNVTANGIYIAYGKLINNTKDYVYIPDSAFTLTLDTWGGHGSQTSGSFKGIVVNDDDFSSIEISTGTGLFEVVFP